MTETGWMEFLQTGLPEPFRQGIALLAYLLMLMWVLFILDAVLLGRRLTHLGIVPRQLAGIPGILVAPLLHRDLRHLSANSAPLAILGTLILFQGLDVLVLVTAIVWGVSGVGIWLVGRPNTRHLGISGVIFGYLGYLLFRGYFERSGWAMAISILVGLLYGGVLWGLLPTQRDKSWVGHGTGFLAGIWVARYLQDIQLWLMQNVASTR
jgi:membrane associated rhomboid family serine protease